MLRKEFSDRLKNSITIGDIHYKRVVFAHKMTKELFPLNSKKYNKLDENQISFIDQLIFRFSKLQDLMGTKLFPLILEGLKENYESLPFIDILNKLERLHIVEDTEQWLSLRETRNLITHEYPFNIEETVEGINTLNKQVEVLCEIWKKVRNYSVDKFGL